MELKFESFGFPPDGLTVLEELDSYSMNNRTTAGYSAVGVVSAQLGNETKLYAVMRITTEQVVAKALADKNAAEKSAVEARAKQVDVERQLKDAMAQIARLMTQVPVGESTPEEQVF